MDTLNKTQGIRDIYQAVRKLLYTNVVSCESLMR
jgi:hypothetical protein